MQGLAPEMNEESMQEGDLEAYKKALQVLIQVMNQKMDFGLGDEEMTGEEMEETSEAMGEEEQEEYDPVAAGDTQGAEEEGEVDDFKAERENFFKVNRSPSQGSKSIAIMGIGSKPKMKSKVKKKVAKKKTPMRF